MAVLASDIRHIFRSLARRPAFTISAVATLSLGLAGDIGIMAIAGMDIICGRIN